MLNRANRRLPIVNKDADDESFETILLEALDHVNYSMVTA